MQIQFEKFSGTGQNGTDLRKSNPQIPRVGICDVEFLESVRSTRDPVQKRIASSPS